MTDEEMYKKAYAEILIIFEHLSDELINLIPPKFIKFLEDNADLEHTFEYDASKPVNEQRILKETRTMLALVYEEYFKEEV